MDKVVAEFWSGLSSFQQVGLVVAAILAILFLVVFLLSLSTQQEDLESSELSGEESNDSEFTQITIFAPDGKVLESLVVETDSIEISEDMFEAVDEKGKNVTYLTNGYLVKMVDKQI